MLYQIKHMCAIERLTLSGNDQPVSKENAFLLVIEFKIVIFISVEWDLRTNYCETTNKKNKKKRKTVPICVFVSRNHGVGPMLIKLKCCKLNVDET